MELDAHWWSLMPIGGALCPLLELQPLMGTCKPSGVLHVMMIESMTHMITK